MRKSTSKLRWAHYLDWCRRSASGGTIARVLSARLHKIMEWRAVQLLRKRCGALDDALLTWRHALGQRSPQGLSRKLRIPLKQGYVYRARRIAQRRHCAARVRPAYCSIASSIARCLGPNQHRTSFHPMGDGCLTACSEQRPPRHLMQLERVPADDLVTSSVTPPKHSLSYRPPLHLVPSEDGSARAPLRSLPGFQPP